MSTIKLIIFDFDGVIEDNYEKHFELTEKRFPGFTREEHKQLFDGNIFEELEKQKHRDTGFDVRIPFNEHKITLKTKTKIKESLQRLKKIYLLGIISSAKEEGLNEYLKRNNLTLEFSFVYGAETNFSKKEKFEIVKKEFHLTEKEIIFVTDTLGDIKEAHEAGVQTIAVDFGFHERKRLEKGNPLAIVSSFKELEQTINRLEE